ncbi:helix-turn-helix domain-containing protein [Lacticaseibacillus pantheris]|uniref:helix-turn-helix domain-containing protein n=1 Tax=Lacticaseibacillus pantheris TaxID=171523 RepID=UPI000A84F624|nr:helix-turn-helix transcriptional regulator [Lacticaseibacillus pantheris]
MLVWLKDKREAMGKTQKEIAEMAGLNRVAYNQYENGVRHPNVAAAKKIGKAMDFDWTLFFADEGNTSTPSRKQVVKEA